MHLINKSKQGNAPYWQKVEANEFSSLLEMPDGRDPLQNGWLTITINYSLDFLDRRNTGGKVYVRDGKGYAKDSDGKEFLVKDWDMRSQMDFNRRFLKGEEFWNYKFVLITPRDYNGFDFTCMAGPGWVCRPNVICLFRLSSGGSPTHLRIKVLRPDPSFWQWFTGRDDFRSNSRLYDEKDVNGHTLWHELGHALDQLHIKALAGDRKCLLDANVNDDDCYVEPKGMAPNIMGSGTGLLPLNAKAWRELIAQHTDTPLAKWAATTAVNTQPRRIPLGVSLVAMPDQF